MSIDLTRFKQVMARWSSGITVITSVSAYKWQGIAANSFASVSLNPPLVSVSIDKKLYIHSVIEQSKVFAANILSVHQVELGKRFAGFYADVEDRFAGINCHVAVTGSPILPETVGWVDCQVRHAYDAGDHTIFVGEVVAGDAPVSAPPLAYHNRSWGAFVRQMPTTVELIEAGFAEATSLPSELRIETINDVVDAGVTRVQIGIFSGSPTQPHPADGARVFSSLHNREGVTYSALVLNATGLEQAHVDGLTHVDLAVSINGNHSRQAGNLSVSDTVEQFITLTHSAHEYGMAVRGCILNALDGPISQEANLQRLTAAAQSLVNAGVAEITLADTAGQANPLLVREIVTAVLSLSGSTPVSLRLNDSHGLGLANMLAGLESGINRYETVLAADDPNAGIPTEDAVYLFHSVGIQTGVNLEKLLHISQRVTSVLGPTSPAT
jgi:flavin reductase (DIM6/NTAB) family NADH-FMN oxidoreductase RutF